MSQAKKVQGYHLEGAFWGFVSGIAIAFFAFFLFGTIKLDQIDAQRKQMQFNKFLFHGVAGTRGVLNEKIMDETKINYAIFIANFIKSETANGKSISEILKEESKVSSILGLGERGEQVVATMMADDKLKKEIVVIAKVDMWKTFQSDPNNLNILNKIVSEKSSVPTIIYPEYPRKFIFWMTILIIQITTFAGYLLGFSVIRYDDRYRNVKWYSVNWKKFWTHLLIFLLSPGMWIIVIPWMLWKFVSLDFLELVKKRGEAKLTQKDKKRKEIENGFNPDFLRGRFSEHRKESEELLKKLESKLQKERGTA